MKRIFTSLLLILLLASTAFGQRSSRQQKVNIKAFIQKTVNFDSLTTDTLYANDILPSSVTSGSVSHWGNEEAGNKAYYYLDGTGDKLSLADDPIHDVGTSDFSVGVRFSVTSVATANQFLVHKEAGGIGYGLEVRTDDLWIRFDDNTTDVTAIIGTNVFLADIDYNVIVSFDRSGSATAYINGINVGTVTISTAALTLDNTGAFTVGDDVAGSKVLTGRISSVQLWNEALSATRVNKFLDDGGGVAEYVEVGASQTEIFVNTVARDFSGASAWANVDWNAYDETTDFTVTADAADQYAELAVAEAPMTAGKKYEVGFDVANLVTTILIEDFTGGQTFTTISVEGTGQTAQFTLNTTLTGGFRITAVTNTSSADIDNLTLKSIGLMADYRPENISDGTWYDASGNNLDLSVTNALASNYFESLQVERGIDLSGTTGENDIRIPDNLADAHSVTEAGNAYITYITTDGSEAIQTHKVLHFPEITTPTAITNYAAFYAKNDNQPYFQDGAGVEHEIGITGGNYGEIYLAENGTATTITSANEDQLIENFTEGLTSGFTFEASSNGVISAFADYSGTVSGTVKVTDTGHGLSDLDCISITGTTSYNGIFGITKIDNDNFYITDTWVADDATGTWQQGSALRNTSGETHLYKVTISLSLASAGSNKEFEVSIYIGDTRQTKTLAHRKFSATDIGVISLTGILSVANNDFVVIAVRGLTDATNITFENGNMNLIRI